MPKPKIRVLSRNPDDYQRETKHDIFKVNRNFNSNPDPLNHATEYVRALNAAKLDRVFAKPFLGSLDGHNEGVHVLRKHPSRLATVLSAARDGQVKIWNLPTKKCLSTIQAHHGPINGLSIDEAEGDMFVTVGQDAQLKHWQLPEVIESDLSDPLHSIPLSDVPHSVSHVSQSTDFVTSGEGISVWKLYRDSPIRTYDLGPNTTYFVKCNPIESSIIAGCSSDRSIFLLDTRQKTPLTRVVLRLRTNTISWHPMESYTFVAANEDYNLYTFDIRKFESASIVHQGHTAAVMDVDYSPTGREFVSGSYDRSLRIFNVDGWKSREIYHAPRMQQVLSVLYSMDSSDEMNIRLWKSHASEKLGPLRPREKAAMNYADKLRQKYQQHPEVGRILKHRQIPKSIYSAAKEHKIIKDSQRRKEANRRRYAPEGSMPFVSERAKPIVENGFDE